MLKAVQIVRYFIPNLAPCNASFLCLEWFKNENLLTKNIVMLFSPLHVGSKDKSQMLMLIFFLFVLHVVFFLFFFLLQKKPFFVHQICKALSLSERLSIIKRGSVICVEFHHIHC